jgi:hypothetical protein
VTRYNRIVRSVIVLVVLAAGCEAPLVAIPDNLIVRLPTGSCDDRSASCEYAFGDVNISSEALLALDMRNPAGVIVDPIVTIENASAASFFIDQRPAPGEASPFLVVMRPASPGAQTAELVVADNGLEVRIVLRANVVGDGILVDRPTCEFGQVAVGEASRACPVTLTNQSPQPITLEYLAVLPNVFTFSPSFDAAVTLEPNETHLVDVQGVPTETGPIFGLLSFGYDDVLVTTAVRLSLEGI